MQTHDEAASPSDAEEQRRDITSPDSATKDATRPPGNPPADEQATDTAREKLDQAGGGH